MDLQDAFKRLEDDRACFSADYKKLNHWLDRALFTCAVGVLLVASACLDILFDSERL